MAMKSSELIEPAKIAARKAMLFDRHTNEHRKAQKEFYAIAEMSSTVEECDEVFNAGVTGRLEAVLTLGNNTDKVHIRSKARKEDFSDILTCETTPLPIDMSLSSNEIMMFNLRDKYLHHAYFIETDEQKIKYYKFMSRLACDAIMYTKGSAMFLGLDTHVNFIDDEEIAHNVESKALCDALGNATDETERQKIIAEYGANIMKRHQLSDKHLEIIRQKNTKYIVEVTVLDSPFSKKYESFGAKAFDKSKEAVAYAENVAWNIGNRLKSAIVKKVFHGQETIIKSYDDTFAFP